MKTDNELIHEWMGFKLNTEDNGIWPVGAWYSPITHSLAPVYLYDKYWEATYSAITHFIKWRNENKKL